MGMSQTDKNKKTLEEMIQELSRESKKEVEDFAWFLWMRQIQKRDVSETKKNENNQSGVSLLSEAALAKDWLKPEEDEAWAYLQEEQL